MMPIKLSAVSMQEVVYVTPDTRLLFIEFLLNASRVHLTEGERIANEALHPQPRGEE